MFRVYFGLKHTQWRLLWTSCEKTMFNIDITILSQHIHYVLGAHEDMYNEMANRLNSNELLNVFNEMNVSSVGRVVAYLALVYRMIRDLKIYDAAARRRGVNI